MNMGRPVSVLLVGIGGYGGTYMEAMLKEGEGHGCRLVGVVDPVAERAPHFDAVRALGVPIHADLESFYGSRRADLVVLSTPIHCHVPQIVTALDHGSHVLCEKPVAARIQDVRSAMAARQRAALAVAIGYQWCYSPAVQRLKADIMAGRFGAPRWLTTLASWPRSEAYYRRNGWAGVERLEDGTWVLDSPANNAVAHYLHHMFYLLGDRIDRSATPARVTAELYRTNRIGNYDTAMARCHTDGGVEILFYATHVASEKVGPRITCAFEQATVDYDPAHGGIRATTADGRTIDYGNPHDTPVAAKLWHTVDVVRDEAVVLCGLEAASAQTLVINGMQSSAPSIVELPGSPVAGSADDRLLVVEGLLETLETCRAARALPSEQGVPWSQPGREIDLLEYDHFPLPSHSP